ncbi:hypothetical protein GUITHDRAFT_110356 [Guillardia theta CCMP2712]|uniref:Uncharacterized protein n=1 Tax=Guillardia theta (strain CCMP2712) TaxID=905079 RepID=L1J632_GUITC|nr:hypothetical protein GUITHDRAFT_110356 [Guillardia theta CCMP2712]EKX43550.1 hypothetical protein GUITHDRAFT_110356 [Guillardia theta CCMP2712]|eukprot:XP_005830530.1 hypothetical protein GUITHDRAFT_110356 [Guillardia theta CCMP2712]
MIPAVIRGGGGVPHANMDLEDVEEDIAEARLRQEQAKVERKLENVTKKIDEEEEEARGIAKELKVLETKKAGIRIQLLDKGAGQRYWEDILRDVEEKEKYLRKKEEDLRKKEEDLRKEKQDLRKEKQDLRKEKQDLRKEKQDLRKEKQDRLTKEEINHGIQWMETPLDASELGYEENRKLFSVDRSIMNWNPGTAGKVVLYCRDGFNEQMDFLEEKVCKEGYMGWILGPPGTGKTTTTICFILSKSIEEGWCVMFVRLWKLGIVSCIQVVDGQQRRCDLSSDEVASGVKKILQGWTDKRRKYLVSLDGYV